MPDKDIEKDIEREILKYIKQNLVVANTELDPQTNYSDLGLDSYSLIEMLLFLESKYDCSLLDGSTQKKNLENTESLAEFIYSKI